MHEANAELLDSELLRDAEATNQRPALTDSGDHPVPPLPAGDELKTMTRLPAPTPPPPPMTTMMPPPMPIPPPARASSPPMALPAPQPLPMPQPLPIDRGVPHLQADMASTTKPSWLNALLTSTLPPPATVRDPGKYAIRPATAGAIFAALGLVFAVLALVTGLRGTPDDSITPIVSAAIVLSRALITLGAGALSFVLLRSAERLLVDTGTGST